mgnify:CR=1 FL=1
MNLPDLADFSWFYLILVDFEETASLNLRGQFRGQPLETFGSNQFQTTSNGLGGH